MKYFRYKHCVPHLRDKNVLNNQIVAEKTRVYLGLDQSAKSRSPKMYFTKVPNGVILANISPGLCLLHYITKLAVLCLLLLNLVIFRTFGQIKRSMVLIDFICHLQVVSHGTIAYMSPNSPYEITNVGHAVS